VTQAPAFTSPAHAAALARASLRYLAAADPAQLTTAEQAACLHDLERITAVTTAARANVLCGFTTRHGYTEDADYSPAPGSSTRPASPKAPRPGTPRGPAGPAPTPGS